MGMLRTIAYGGTDTGRVRDHNEDSFAADGSMGLFIVADGVGGGAAGEVASAMLVEHAYAEIARADEESRHQGLGIEDRRKRSQELLPTVLEAASGAIYERAQGDRKLRGMATTGVIVRILGDQAIISHVGDSRLYLIRKGEIFQITQDHSLARELVAKGVLKEEEVPKFRYKNVILRSVGLQPTVQADTVFLELVPGDLLLMCSDGLSDMVDAETIRDSVQGKMPRPAVRALIEAANEAGGVDNITVVIIQVLGTPGPGEEAGTETKASFLKNFFLFNDLSFAETLRLTPCVHERHVRAGETILRQGEEGDRLFLVTSGEVQVLQDKVPLTLISAGGHFGELSLLEVGLRTADVVATEDSSLLTISRGDFFEILRTEPALATKLLWRFSQNLGRRVRELSGRVSQLVREARER